MKTLKNNILLLVLLSLSNCQGFYVPEEHLYIWDSPEDKNVLFVLSTSEQTFKPSSQSLIQYVDQAKDIVFNNIHIYNTDKKNKIKKMGTRAIPKDEAKFSGDLARVDNNTLYNATEIDKSKIAYYPMSTQGLYFRQDTPTAPIDILAGDSQYTFVSLLEYTFVPGKNYYRDPQKS